jgi:release factor glutamine methyltransferase
MLQNHATLQQIRFHLLEELRQIYTENESDAMARLIMEHVGYPLDMALRDPLQVPGPSVNARVDEIIAEMRTGKPIQYVLGQTQFCDLGIRVNPYVLIPRPETEEMVEKIKKKYHKPVRLRLRRIMDLGTGSGCIALALKHAFPDAEVWGTDISEDALSLARENGRLNHLHVNWLHLDLLNMQIPEPLAPFSLVVSNPPYVLQSERNGMAPHITEYEPGSALFVEDHDPLVYYRAIASFCNRFLSVQGEIWVEIHEKLGRETSSLFEKQGFSEVSILKDIHEKERYIHVRR